MRKVYLRFVTIQLILLVMVLCINVISPLSAVELLVGYSVLFSCVFWLFFRRDQARFHDTLETVSEFVRNMDRERFSTELVIEHQDLLYPMIRQLRKLNQRLQFKFLQAEMFQERQTIILHHLRSIVISVDDRQNISYINPSGERFFGVSRIDLLGKPHWRIGRESGLSFQIARAMESKSPVVGELEMKDELETIMEAIIVPVITEQRAQGAVVLLHDVTERGKMERLRREFVGNVSHELKTPLTAIRGYTETLLNGAIKDEETAIDFLNIMLHEANRLQKLVDDLLDLSRLEHKKPSFDKTAVDVNDLIQKSMRVMEISAEAKNIRLEAELPESHVWVPGDTDRLNQVFINLISNAIQYTPAGGKVMVHAEEDAGQVRVHVIDTGIGIPAEHLSRIFERFYRVDQSRQISSGGRGLGLSIVKHIVNQHKGTIYVNSTVGEGTTFTVVLPAKQP